jgi:hypothetical protein
VRAGVKAAPDKSYEPGVFLFMKIKVLDTAKRTWRNRLRENDGDEK